MSNEVTQKPNSVKLVEKCREIFDKYDEDKSGAIDAIELKVALKELGWVMLDGEIVDLLHLLGAGPDGAIDFETFLNFCLNQARIMDQRWQRKAETMDAYLAIGGAEDGSGAVDQARIEQAVSDFELKVNLNDLFADVDKDKNGSITYDEFQNFLKNENEDEDSNLHKHGNRWLRYNIKDVKHMHQTAELAPFFKERRIARSASARQADNEAEAKMGEEKDPFARLKWLEQLDRQFHAKIRLNEAKETEKRRKTMAKSLLSSRAPPPRKKEDTDKTEKLRKTLDEASTPAVTAPARKESPKPAASPSSQEAQQRRKNSLDPSPDDSLQMRRVKDSVNKTLYPTKSQMSFKEIKEKGIIAKPLPGSFKLAKEGSMKQEGSMESGGKPRTPKSPSSATRE